MNVKHQQLPAWIGGPGSKQQRLVTRYKPTGLHFHDIVVAVLGEAPVRIHCKARGDIGQLIAAWVRGGRGDPRDEPKRICVDVIDRRRRIDVLDFLEDLVVRASRKKTAVPAGMVMMRGSPKNGQHVRISSVSE